MLLVNARVGKSTTHGLGLIAKEFLPAGTIIWKFMSGFDIDIQESSSESLSLNARQQVIHYAEYRRTSQTFGFSSDDDRFTHHSDNPYTWSSGDIVTASSDINERKDITCDYHKVVMYKWIGFAKCSDACP